MNENLNFSGIFEQGNFENQSFLIDQDMDLNHSQEMM